MGIADDLQKLEQLLKSGALTDAEFQKAKSILLEDPTASSNPRITPFVEEQLAQVRYQNELARIDREWEIEREQHRIVGRHGRTYFPTVGMGVGMAIAGGVFGIFWTIVAIAIVSAIPSDLSFGMIKLIFPILAAIFTVVVVARGIACCIRAQKYHEAYHAYKENRALIMSPQG